MSKNFKTAVMYGAGSIGRGFIGQLFTMSGYEVCFIDVDEKLVSKLNEEHEYRITIAAGDGYETRLIENVRAVNGKDTKKAAFEIASCSIMATAVGVNILPYISQTIAMGMDLRFETHGELPLDIIVCENISGGGMHLKTLVAPHMKNKAYMEKCIGFVSASVGRMVPVGSASDSSDIIVEPYDELPIDADALKTDVSGLSNFKPTSPFEIEKYKKYYMHNMSHAITAYLGHLKGYEYIWEAIQDKYILGVTKAALAESISAISSHFSTPAKPLEEYALDLLERYANRYLNDTVLRVGRDPKRKLAADDRLTGAAVFCIENNIVPEYIPYGIAAAFYFDSPDDASSVEILSTVKEEGIRMAIEKYTGLRYESALFEKVLSIYKSLEK
ncbi:MAG: mannitol dehydrogenase [Clostridia bacterium]